MEGVKNFTVWEIFEYDRGKESAPKQVEDWDCPMINETSENNWLTKYAKPTKILKGNSITVSVNFAQTVFYQPKDFCASVNIMSLYNEKFSPLSYMYVITQLRKKHAHFSYWGKISKDRLLEEVITLPIYSNWEIAYDYMENYIKEIEAYHVKEIEAYLQSTGLSNYKLTREEELALENILSSPSKKFTLDELFEKIERWQRLKKDDQISGKIPFVTAWFNNTWITNYISNPIAQFPWNSISIDMFWNVFYRDYEFWADDNISVYYDKNKQKSKLINLYLTSVLSKRIKGTFSYGKQFRCSKNMDLEITLPVDSDNQINYPLIETYIKATQKLVIKDLVDNINRKLETYKDII